MSTDRIVRPKEAASITGRSLSSIWRDEKAGLFPQRVRIGHSAVGYRHSELMQWIDGCSACTEPIKQVAVGARRGRKPRTASVVEVQS